MMNLYTKISSPKNLLEVAYLLESVIFGYYCAILSEPFILFSIIPVVRNYNADTQKEQISEDNRRKCGIYR